MTRCRILEFCEWYEIDLEFLIPKAKEFFVRMLSRGIYVYTFIKIINVLFGRKTEKTLDLMGYKKLTRISNVFKILKKKII